MQNLTKFSVEEALNYLLFSISSESDSDILIFLACTCHQFRTTECVQLASGDARCESLAR